MPYVGRRTMRWYRRLDTWVFAPIQYTSFILVGLAMAYVLIGSIIVTLVGGAS